MPIFKPRASFLPSMILLMAGGRGGSVLRGLGFEIRQQMAELGALGAEIMNVAVARRHLEGNALDHLNAVDLKPADLARVVGEQGDLVHTEVAQDLRADAVIAQILLEAELEIGLHRVAPLVL